MTVISNLVIEMSANVARLRTDMEQANRTVQASAASMQRAAKVAAEAIAAIGGALVVQAFAQSARRAVDYLASIQDAAEITGASVRDLTGLLSDVAPSGARMADVTDAAVKMAKAMQEARDQTSAQAQFFKVLGVSATDAAGNLRPVDAVMREVAKAQAAFADGTSKSAAFLAGLGKTGAATLPMFNDLAEGTGKVDEALAKAVAEGDRFDKMLKRVGSDFDQANAKFWTPLLTGINAIAEAFRTANKDGLSFVETLKTIPGANASQSDNAQMLAAKLARARESQERAERGSSIFGVNQVAVLDAQQKVEALERQLRASLGRIESVDGPMANRAPTPDKPVMPDIDKLKRDADERAKSGSKAVEEAAKRQREILDGNAKAAIERLKRYEEAERMADEAIAERQAALAKAYDQRHDAAMKTVVALAEEVKRQREATEEIGLTSEQVTQLRIAREELTLATLEEAHAEAVRKGEASGELDLLGEQITLTRKLIDARREGAAREAEVEAAKRVRDEWKRTGEQIEQGLVDSLFRAAEAGKDVFSTLRDSLRGMFNNLVLRPVIQAAVGGLGLGGAGSAMAGGGGGGGAGSMLSAGSSLGGLAGAAGTFGSFASTGLMSSLSGVGLGTSMGAAGSLAAGGSVLGGAGMAIGAAAPYALAAIAAYKIIRSLTKKRVTASGIEGTLGGAAGFEGNSFEEFRRKIGGGGRSTSALDPTFQSGISDAVSQTRTAVSGYAEALGLPVAALQTYTQALRIDTRGLSAEQIQEKVSEAVQGFADGLAGTLGEALTAFSREGESASETLTRLSSSLTSVNATLGALNQALLAIGPAGGDAASKLLELFGGADQFAQAASSFLGSFYDDAERARMATSTVQEALAPLGIALPGTRAEFRGLVEAMDLTTDYGRRAYATLLQVAPQYAVAASYAEQQAQAASDAANESAQAAVREAEARVEEARRVREAWAGVGASLLDEVNRIRGEMANDPLGDFATLTAQARAGDMSAAQQLPEAARTLIDAARRTSASDVDFARAQAQVAASLGETAGFVDIRANAALPGVPTVAPVSIAPVVEAVLPIGQANVTATNAVETALREELGQLRAELRAANAAVAASTAETTRILARWDGDSMPPTYAEVNGGSGAP